jgi:putative transposase
LYRNNSKINTKDNLLLPLIKDVMMHNPAYGHKRIAIALGLNKKRVLRVMKKFNLNPARRRIKRPIKQSDIGKNESKYRNLIKELIITKPNEVWAGDFTYIPYEGKFIYLCTVTDIFTRRLVGWNISTKHTAMFVKEALRHGIKRIKTIPEIFHCDQGSEYDSKEFLEYVENQKVKISMSRKAAPWENGYQESLYAGFKLDLGNTVRFKTLGELIEAIYQTISYYNNKRIHTKLKMPPEQYYLNYLNKQNNSINTLEPLYQKLGT